MNTPLSQQTWLHFLLEWISNEFLILVVCIWQHDGASCFGGSRDPAHTDKDRHDAVANADNHDKRYVWSWQQEEP